MLAGMLVLLTAVLVGVQEGVSSCTSCWRKGIDRHLVTAFSFPPSVPPFRLFLPFPGSHSIPVILHPLGRHQKGLGPPARGSEVSHKGVTASLCPEVHDYSIGLKSVARAAYTLEGEGTQQSNHIYIFSFWW